MALVLAGIVRPLVMDPIDRDQGAIENHERLPASYPDRITQVGTGVREDVDSFGDMAVHRGHPDAEPGGQHGVGVAVTQVRQHQQRLLFRRQLAPPRSDRSPVFAELSSQELQCSAGQIDRKRVRQQSEAPGSTTGDLGRHRSYQELHPSLITDTPRADPTKPRRLKLKKAH